MNVGYIQKTLSLAMAGLAALTLWGCGSGGSGSGKITVNIFPAAVNLLVNNTQQFVAASNGKDTTVTWSLNGNPASDTMSPVGKISTTGLYTAPPTVPNPLPSGGIVVKATANQDKTTNATATVTLDSGIVVTIAPGSATIGISQSFQFIAQPPGVTWSVASGSNGTIDAGSGLYTAPAAVPNPATFTVQAASNLDPTKKATASVTIVTVSGPPTLTSINPTSGAQGSLFQDIYLNGTNLLSTTIVKFNGNPVPASGIIVVNPSLMRVRVPEALLAVLGAPLTVAITVEQGFVLPPPGVTGSANFSILPVRPALVESIPDSSLQSSLSTTIQINGGYFGSAISPGSPVVLADFNGGSRVIQTPPPSSVIFNARSLTVNLNNGDLAAPGLYSLDLRNSAVAQTIAAANFAVQPDPATNGPSLLVKLGTPLTTLAPRAVGVDTALGIAVVANTGGNTVQLIDLKPATPVFVAGGTITVGNAPTGVAVDNQHHIALVVNSTDKTVSIVDLVAKTATTPLLLGSFASATPFSVGVNPNTGLALVAYSSTNSGLLIALAGTTSTHPCLTGSNPSPPCVVGSVNLNSGPAPQIAVEPRFNWAIATPGGAGLLSIVDLNRQNSIAIAAAATPGAKRTANIVTITTTSPHNLDPTNPSSVLITGVADLSFNGTFTVASVPSGTTFTYNQTAGDASSGGGTLQYANPLVTFTVSPTIQGVSINTETEKALLADPNSSDLIVLSALDQTNTSLFLTNGGGAEQGARYTAFNPFTNVGVSVNPTLNQLSVIDPVKPQRLGTAISTGGTGSGPVAVDPGANLAVVANTSSNDVSIISLGAMKPLHVSEVVVPTARQLVPAVTFTSATDLSVMIFGHGFSTGTPSVRLDGTPLPALNVSVASDRLINATIPAATYLTAPRRFALDVVNGTDQSNAAEFTVVQAVDVTSSGCSAPLPAAVAIALGIDASHPDLAVVANSGCNNVSLIDVTPGGLNFGTVTNTIAVGTAPEGVATISRLGHAVVTNSGSNNASVVDLVGGTVISTVATGTQPLGVAINQDTAIAVAANAVSNTLSVFDANLGGTAGSAATDQRPVSVAIDPNRNILLVSNTLLGTLQVFTMSSTNTATFSKTITIGSSTIPPLATSLAFDPASGLFFAASALNNQFLVVNTDAGSAQTVRVGINPTSLAYNYLSSTLVTVNTASNTISVVDAQAPQTLRTKAIQSISNSAPCPVDVNTGVALCAVDIHPRTNLAVITDPANKRVLLFPLAK